MNTKRAVILLICIVLLGLVGAACQPATGQPVNVPLTPTDAPATQPLDRATATIAAETSIPSPLPTLFSSTVDLPIIAPQACVPSEPIELLLGYLPEHPAQLISGGYVQSGDFIFEIWLGCDPLFGPNPEYSNHYSDIPGLGLHLVLSYRGKAVEGQIDDGWGIMGEGVPLLIEGEGSSTSGMIFSSIVSHLAGLRIPAEIQQDLSSTPEIPLEFVYQARNPEGEWTGAALTFTLVNKPDGFYVTNTNLQPLSAQDLAERGP